MAEIVLALLLILTLIVNLYFAFIVFNRDKYSETNIFFSLMLIGIDLWAVSNFFYNDPQRNYSAIVFWMRMIFVSTTPFIYFLLNFSFAYPNNKSSLKSLYKIILFFPTACITVLSLGTFIIKGASINNKIVMPVFNDGIWIYLTYTLTYVTLSLIVLFKKYRHANGITRSQLQYLFLGLLLFTVPATITNLIMVVVFRNVSLTTFGPNFSLFLGFFLSYAILKHRLFDIYYLSTVFVRYVIISIYVYFCFYLTIAINILLFKSVFSTSSLITNVCIAILFSLSFFPVNDLVSKTLSQSFKKLADKELLNKLLNKIIVDTPDFEELSSKFLSALSTGLGLNGIGLIAFVKKNENYEVHKATCKFNLSTVSEILTKNRDFFEELQNLKSSILKTEIDKDYLSVSIKAIFRSTRSKLIVPVKTRNETLGLLFFGRKISEQIYSIQDVKFIEDISNSLAIPLQRSILLKDVNEFATVLEEKIAQATETLRKQKEALQEKYQFEKDMMGIMGHELRTPMTVAKGMSELVIAKVNEQNLKSDYLKNKMEKIYDSILKEADLIQTMLSTSHIDNNKLNLQITDVDLLEVIRYTVSAFKHDAKAKGLQFIYQKPDFKIPLIRSDVSRIQEIINNLVSNAVKYTNHGYVRIWFELKNDAVYLNVEDTGIGIPHSEIKNIGKKFHRINQYLDKEGQVVRSGGTGLGLYVVKGLLKALGGELIIKTKLGKGSTFTVVFPLTSKFHNNVIISDKPIDEKDMFETLGLKVTQK